MDYGLSRIILIDSYLPGRSYIIDLNGHTNVMGENGMGKTTLIKLAVLFYGESPTKLGIKRNEALSHDGFAEYYLPRSGSYVIFEYLSAGEPRMLVLTSLPNTKEQFRRTFVKSGFKREDFWRDDSESPLKAEQWLREIPLKYMVENCPGHEAQTRKLLEGRDPHFSAVPTRLNLTRMKNLMTSMFSRKAGHTELTKIIEEWARSDLGDEFIRQMDTISVPRAELEAWLANYYSNRAIEHAKGRFNTLGNLIREHETTHDRAQGLYALGKQIKNALTTQMETDAAAFKLNFEQMQCLIRTQDESLVGLRKDYKECYGHWQQLNGEKTSLDQTLKAFSKEIPPNYAELIANSTGVRTRIEQITAEIHDITAGQKQVNEWKSTQLNEAKLLLQEKRQAIRESLQSAEFEKYKSILDHDKQLDLQMTSRRSQFDLDKSAMAKQQTEQAEVVSLLKGRLIAPSLSSDELAVQIKLKAEVDRLENQRELANQERELANKALGSAKREHEAEYTKLTTISGQLNDRADELAELLEIVNAQDGSLLSFLKQQVPGWQETHGLALKPEVLRAKGLAPKLKVDADPCTIFGVQIEVAALPEHYLDLGDDNKLREQVLALEEVVATLSQEQERLNNSCVRLFKKISEAEQRVTLASSDYEKKNNLYTQFKADLAAENARLDACLLAHKEQLKSQLAAEEASYQTLSGQMKVIESQQQGFLEEVSAKKLKFEHEADLTLQQTKNALTQQEAIATVEYQQREKEIHDQYHHQLKEKGIDSNYVAKLTTELDALKKQDVICKQAESAHTALLVYRSETYDPRYPQLSAELTATNEQCLSIREAAARCETEIARLTEEKKALEDNHEHSKRLLTRSLAKIDDGILIFTDFETFSAPVINERYEVEQLCQHFKELRSRLKTSIEQIRAFNVELQPLFRTPGTGAFRHLTSDPGNVDDPLQIAKRLYRYLDGGFYHVDYSSFIQSTQNFDRLTLYVDYLRQFKAKVQRYNRGLNEYMVRAVVFNVIDHLEVDITFQYSDKNDWALINNIAEQYQAWKNTKNVGRFDSSQIELPQSGLAEAIEIYLNTPNSGDMSINELHKHIDFATKFTDNGRQKTARSFLDIMSDGNSAASNGTSYLILITIFVGILNMMRKGRNIHFTWALDELADISPINIGYLLQMLGDNQINLISACTVASESVYSSFNKTYTLERDPDTGEMVMADEEIIDPIEELLSGLSNNVSELPIMEGSHA